MEGQVASPVQLCDTANRHEKERREWKRKWGRPLGHNNLRLCLKKKCSYSWVSFFLADCVNMTLYKEENEVQEEVEKEEKEKVDKEEEK